MIEYLYTLSKNGEGIRVAKDVDGAVTNYLYEYDKVVLELNGDGTQKARNVYGTNLISRTVDGQTLYYLYNGHSDVVGLLDESGNLVGSYYYDAFGNITEQTGNVDNNITYAGYHYDSETNTYYLMARHYDPVTARFLSEDTYRGQIDDPLSLNLYTYCHNNPLIYHDPTGHWPEWSDIKNTYNAGKAKIDNIKYKAYKKSDELAYKVNKATDDIVYNLNKATDVAVYKVYKASDEVKSKLVATKDNLQYGLKNPDIVAREIQAKVTKSILTNLLKDSETKANETYVNSAIKQLDRQGIDSSSLNYTNMLINQAQMNKDMTQTGLDMFGFGMYGGIKTHYMFDLNGNFIEKWVPKR